MECKRILVLAVAASLVGSAVIAGTANAHEFSDDDETPLEQVEEAMESTGHDLDEHGTVVMDTSTSDEPVQRTMTGHEILDVLAETSLADPEPLFADAPDALQVPLSGGPMDAAVAHAGAGSEQIEEEFNPDWPFCHRATIMALYVGPFQSAVVADVETGEEGPPLEGECAEEFGSTEYRSVTLDVAAANPSGSVGTTCGFSVVMTTPDETFGNENGGEACGHALANLNGAATEIHFSFYQLSFDAYFGSRGHVQLAG